MICLSYNFQITTTYNDRYLSLMIKKIIVFTRDFYTVMIMPYNLHTTWYILIVSKYVNFAKRSLKNNNNVFFLFFHLELLTKFNFWSCNHHLIILRNLHKYFLNYRLISITINYQCLILISVKNNTRCALFAFVSRQKSLDRLNKKIIKIHLILLFGRTCNFYGYILVS